MPISCSCLPGRGSPVKNALAMYVSFFLIFMGYNGTLNLVSTVAIRDGLGVTSQTVVYSVFIVGAITLPSICARAIGLKWTMAGSALLFTPYIAANFKPSWYTFMPAAVLVGLASGPLWSAGLSYLTAMAKRYSVARGQAKADGTVFLFVGFLYMFLGLATGLGNLTSFYVLKPQDTTRDKNLTAREMEVCGVNFCDWVALDEGVIQLPPQEKVSLLSGLYLAYTVAGVLVAILTLEGVDLEEVGLGSKENQVPIKELLVAPLKRFRIAQHWFILPITVFTGISDSFLYGDYTKAYVACSWGVYHIGFSGMCSAAATFVSAPFVAVVVQRIDRAYMFALAGMIQAGAVALLWLWTPEFPKFVLLIIPTMIGIDYAILQSQVRAFYAVLFSEDKSVAYSALVALESIGYMTGFGISSKVCTGPKLWLMAVCLVVSGIGYGVAEFNHRKGTSLVKNSPAEDAQCSSKF